MDNIAGSPVEGENFFGRENDVKHLSQILTNDDVLLLGPRRIGKTSIARAVMASVRAQGWRAIEINVASCMDERGFLDKLNTALTPELASVSSKIGAAIADGFKAATNRVKSLKVPLPGAGSLGIELGEANAEEWTKVGCDVIQLIGAAEARWLIYVDELPIMLFNIIRADPQAGTQRVRRFLDWFRNDVRAIPGAHSVRWLVSGSVGLDTLVHQHAMADTINSLSHQSLAAFKDELAVEMLLRLSTRYQIPLSETDAQAMVGAVHWAQPYYLQIAFHHLRTLLSERPDTALKELIDEAIDTMVQPGMDNDFHHWEQRLDMQLSRNDAAHARAILKLAAQDPLGAKPETLLAVIESRMPNEPQEDAQRVFINLRDILERDAYWWPDASSGAKRYRFRLEPLRRWWLRRNTL